MLNILIYVCGDCRTTRTRACHSLCVLSSLRLRSCLRLVSPFNDNVECACALLWVVSALWGQEPEEQDGQPLNQVSHIVYGAICLLYAVCGMRYMRSKLIKLAY